MIYIAWQVLIQREERNCTGKSFECGLFVLLPRRRAKERRCMNRALLCALVVIRACDLLLFLNQNFPVCSGKFMLISGWILARLAQW